MKRRRPEVKLTLSPDAHRLFRERARASGLPRSQYLESLLRVGRAPVHVPPGSEATLTLGKGCEVRAAVFEGGGFANFVGGTIVGIDPAYRASAPQASEEVRDEHFKRGVEAAADVAATYNSSTTHDYRLDDCILCKLNQTNRKKPRRNKAKLENPEHAVVRGSATVLAEMLRLSGGGDSQEAERFSDRARTERHVRAVLQWLSVTLAEMRKAGTSERDLRELKKAGVP